MTKFEIKKLGTTWCVAETDGMEFTSHSFRTRKAAVEFVNTSKKNQLKTAFEKLSDEQKKQIESKADFADEIYTIGFEKDCKDFSEFVDEYAAQLHELFDELGYKQPLEPYWD